MVSPGHNELKQWKKITHEVLYDYIKRDLSSPDDVNELCDLQPIIL